jgi:4'-phosphopantetheinyl transferase
MVPEARQTSRAARTAAPTLWLAGAAARRRFDASALSSADRRRWAQMVSVAHRAEWMSSRALLVAQGPAPGESSSLSHSGGFAALLTGPARMRIGVDLERVKRRDFARLAGFGFDVREVAALSGLPARARSRNFYIMWTLKEAAAKALGIGLWQALGECVFIPGTQGWVGRLPGRAAWRAWVYAPRRNLVLAVVCVGSGARRARAPRCREWPANGRKASAKIDSVRPSGLRRKA